MGLEEEGEEAVALLQSDIYSIQGMQDPFQQARFLSTKVLQEKVPASINCKIREVEEKQKLKQ